MSTLLAVDLSYQSYRASAAHPTLSSGDTFTGGLYGFLVALASAIRATGARSVVVCQDRKPYRRSLTYPEYKQLRKKTQDEELVKRHKLSMSLILEMLDVVGLPAWGIDGYESDDLVAHCVRSPGAQVDEVVAASNDSDLYQLFDDPSFKVYRKDGDIMNGVRLWKETGLSPSQFMLATALMGTHNDIAGIPRVGEKTAIKAVLDPALMRTYRASHGELIERNLSLIKLPHPDFPTRARIPSRGRRFELRAFYRWCAQYDIEATAPMISALEQLD